MITKKMLTQKYRKVEKIENLDFPDSQYIEIISPYILIYFLIVFSLHIFSWSRAYCQGHTIYILQPS